MMNFVIRNPSLFISSAKILGDEEEGSGEGAPDTQELEVGLFQVSPTLFHHPKIDSYILRSLQDPYTLTGGKLSDTVKQVFNSCPFLFPFQTRQLFFKLFSFIGAIDMNRSIYFLKKYI